MSGGLASELRDADGDRRDDAAGTRQGQQLPQGVLDTSSPGTVGVGSGPRRPESDGVSGKAQVLGRYRSVLYEVVGIA
jgi:hypothetical protein